jgi:hypothetical protein
VVDFFNHVNMLYGTISEFCTPSQVSQVEIISTSSGLLEV